jgi:hypothetical protein
MKLHSTAAFALLGWSLMCPPLYHPCWPIGAVQEILGIGGLCERPIPDRDAPMSQWIQAGAYSSAEECQSQTWGNTACKCAASDNSSLTQMNPAAAATPVGYYLMTPPMVYDKGAKTDAPLSEWSGQWNLKDGQQRKPYPTLQACEDRKAAVRRAYLDESRAEAEKDADLSKLWIQFSSAYAQAQCVQSDDPRLN